MNGFHASSVYQCWRIARRTAIAYQRRQNRATTIGEQMLCRTARDVADRIALTIRYGPAHNKRHKGGR